MNPRLRSRLTGGHGRPLLGSIIGLVAGAMTLVSAAGWAATTATTIKVHVNGMVCAFCIQGIERKLRSLPGTQTVQVNLEQRLVSITLRPGGQISDEQLRRLIRDAGFDVRQIERQPASP